MSNVSGDYDLLQGRLAVLNATRQAISIALLKKETGEQEVIHVDDGSFLYVDR